MIASNPIHITVQLPQPVRVDGRERIALIVGANQTWVEVDGTGMVTVHHGGEVLYGINVLTAARAVTETGHAATEPEETP